MEVGTIWKYVNLRHVVIIIRGISRVTEDILMKKNLKKAELFTKNRDSGKISCFFHAYMHTN